MPVVEVLDSGPFLAGAGTSGVREIVSNDECQGG